MWEILFVYLHIHWISKNSYCRKALWFFCSVLYKPVCECGEFFKYKYKLVNHWQNHVGERPHKCSKCGKFFQYHSNFIKHWRNHMEERPDECREYGKVFSHKNVLFQHQKTHTGERPYTCRNCQKAFIRKSHLLHHQKIHNEDNMSAFNVKNSLGTTPMLLWSPESKALV